MSYKSLIRAQLTRAFKAVKDLAVDAVLIQKTQASFNFGTGQVSSTAADPVVAKIVITGTERKKTEDAQEIKSALLQIKGIADIGLYDRFTIDSVAWRISEIVMKNDFVALVKITKDS